MPLTRLAVCFDGRISIYDRFFTKPPSPPSALPVPHVSYSSSPRIFHFYTILVVILLIPASLYSTHIHSSPHAYAYR